MILKAFEAEITSRNPTFDNLNELVQRLEKEETLNEHFKSTKATIDSTKCVFVRNINKKEISDIKFVDYFADENLTGGGHIEFCTFDKNHICAFVYYRDAEASARVLSNGRITIGQYTFSVEPFKNIKKEPKKVFNANFSKLKFFFKLLIFVVVKSRRSYRKIKRMNLMFKRMTLKDHT